MSAPPSAIRRRSRSLPHRQRGVAAVFAGIAIVLLVTVMGLAIEIGRLYYAQREVESLATLAALDGARVVSGCTASGDGLEGSIGAVTAEVAASIARNNVSGNVVLTMRSNVPTVELGFLSDASDSTNTSGLRRFVPARAGSTRHDVVRVNLSRAQPALLFPFLGTASGQLYASATAKQAALGSFYVGATLASVNSANSALLNPLLRGLFCADPGSAACKAGITIDAAGFKELLGVGVSLDDLATALDVNVKDLSDPLKLATQTPLLSDVLNGLADALAGAASSTVINTLRGLAAGAQGNPGTVPLGQLLGVVGTAASQVPFVDLLDLLLGLGEATNAATNGAVKPISLPINIDLPGLATVNTFLKIGAPPKFSTWVSAGPDSITRTAELSLLVRISGGAALNQLKGTIDGVINSTLGLLKLANIIPSVTSGPGPLNIGIDIAVVPADATLDALQCPRAGINDGLPTASLSARTTIATANIGTFSGNAKDAPPLTPTGSLPLAEVKVDATAACLGVFLNNVCVGLTVDLGKTDVKLDLPLTSAVLGGGSGNQPLNDVTQFTRLTTNPDGSPLPANATPIYLANGGPGQQPVSDNPQTIGSPVSVQLKLGPIASTPVGGAGLTGLLSGLIVTVLNAATGLLQPVLDLVNGLASSLVDPLLGLLGIQLGTATVTMDAVTVDQPHLVTTCVVSATGPSC